MGNEQWRYLEAGRIIDAEDVPEELRDTTIIRSCRSDITEDYRFTVIDTTGKRINRYDGTGLFFGPDTYEELVGKGYVDLDGVDMEIIRVATLENESSDEPWAELGLPSPYLPSLDEMRHFSDIEVQCGLYYDEPTQRFYLGDGDGRLDEVPWERVSYHFAAGDLRFEQHGNERYLREELINQRKRKQQQIDEETKRSAEEQLGRLRREHLLAVVMLAIGIAAGYGLSLVLH